jgi:hypothetical protein
MAVRVAGEQLEHQLEVVVAAGIAVGWHIAMVAWGVAGLEEQDR